MPDVWSPGPEQTPVAEPSVHPSRCWGSSRKLTWAQRSACALGTRPREPRVSDGRAGDARGWGTGGRPERKGSASGATRTQAQPTAIGAPEPLRVAEGPDCRTAVCVQGTTPLGMPGLSPRGPWPPGGRGPHPQAGPPPGSPVRDVRGSGELCKPPWQHMKPLAGGEAAAAGTVFGRAACSGPSAVNIYSSPGATCSPCSHREPTPHCPAARGGQLAGDSSQGTGHTGQLAGVPATTGELVHSRATVHRGHGFRAGATSAGTSGPRPLCSRVRGGPGVRGTVRALCLEPPPLCLRPPSLLPPPSFPLLPSVDCAPPEGVGPLCGQPGEPPWLGAPGSAGKCVGETLPTHEEG